jgi:hypothetical protein
VRNPLTSDRARTDLPARRLLENLLPSTCHCISPDCDRGDATDGSEEDTDVDGGGDDGGGGGGEKTRVELPSFVLLL